MTSSACFRTRPLCVNSFSAVPHRPPSEQRVAPQPPSRFSNGAPPQFAHAVSFAHGEPQAATDESGNPITVWDRRSYKTDLLTNRDVPDQSKRVPVLIFHNPKPTCWPQADFIVGTPPFIGNKRMRDALGTNYVDSLRLVYPSVPESADFVMYWWHKAAELCRAGVVHRFGLITTNSLRQAFARRVVQAQLVATPPLSLTFTIPDHPWVDNVDGASVRIAMTVGRAGVHDGDFEVLSETPLADGSVQVALRNTRGRIQSDISIGAHVACASRLDANSNICFQGVILVGDGFRLSTGEVCTLKQRMGTIPTVVRRHISGKDLLNGDRGNSVIDLFGISDESSVRLKYPELYQHLSVTVKPERLLNREKSRREKWWLFGRSNETMRAALAGLDRYIATVETSKCKLFAFVPSHFCPDHKLYVIASSDATLLGVLSSSIHLVWALAAGGTLEDRPTWTNTTCFLPFPFPHCSATERERIRSVAEELDAHRKRAQVQHSLTLTAMYNVWGKLRTATSLTEKERGIHDKGLVSILRKLHDDLDAAVFSTVRLERSLAHA
jgi:hypothetical protein